MKITMNPNEMVVKASDGRFLLNGTSIKGKLILTTQRIYFKPETNGKEYKDVEIYPNNIKEVMFFKNRPIMPTGLNIVTKGGIENKFLVSKRASWNAEIVKMC
jgi:hypothetical protein